MQRFAGACATKGVGLASAGSSRGKYVKLRINQKELDEHEELVRELLNACEEYSRG